jgi:membrane-associated protein
VTSVIALPALMDPMYGLGNGGVFGSAVLVGVMVIIFIETGLLFPFLPGDTLLFIAGMIAAQATTPSKSGLSHRARRSPQYWARSAPT